MLLRCPRVPSERHWRRQRSRKLPKSITPQLHVRTENLEGLSFRVSPGFRKRFKQRAVNADLKLNELLFEALEAWEKQNGVK